MRTRRVLATLALAALGVVPFPAASAVAGLAAPPSIVEPAANAVVATPSTHVVVRFHQGETIALFVNGVRVPENQIASTVPDPDGTAVATYIGVALNPGDNTITAQVLRGDAPSAPSEIHVGVRGAATDLRLTLDRHDLPADGRSLVTVSGRLTDAGNNLAARDALVSLRTTAGAFVGDTADPDVPGYTVKAHDGVFMAVIRAGLSATTMHIEAKAGDLLGTADLDVTTSLRPSVATGSVNLRLGHRETNFYNSITNFLDADPSSKAELQTRGFATGAVGSYLVTVAGDSAYPINPACNGLIGISTYDVRSCDPRYPVYGDQSSYDRLAQSSDNVFARIERNRSYAMWGDFGTSEFATSSQLYSATSRELHGSKINIDSHHLVLTGLYGNNVQAFQRDSIAPDGTSGYYYLSHHLLLPGSETVAIETQVFDRPGLVTSVTPLNRGADYDIDYDSGSLLFHAPVTRTDIDPVTGAILVRIIVVTYQYDDGQGAGSIVGGRLRYRFGDQLAGAKTPGSIGASLLQENQGINRFILAGVDAGIPLGNAVKVIGEYAHSTNDSSLASGVGGSAYRAEAQLSSSAATGTAYYRTTGAGFANQATTSFIPGQTQQGANLITPIAPKLHLVLNYDAERQSGIAPELLTDPVSLLSPGATPIAGASLDTRTSTVSAGLRHDLGRGFISVDYALRTLYDANAPLFDASAAQLDARVSLPFAKRWSFLAEDDINLRSQIDPAYPDRIAAGLEYALSDAVKIAATKQYLRGTAQGSRQITSIESIFDEKLSSSTSFTGRYAIVGGIDGTSAQTEFGLKQNVKLAPGVHMDLAYQLINGDFFDLTPSGMQFAQPYAVGQAGQAALGVTGGSSISVGAEYTGSKELKGDARYEHRISASGSNTTYSGGVAGKITPAFTLLASIDAAGGANQTLGALADALDFRAGMAYRNPATDDTNVLLRFEERLNPGLIPQSLLSGGGTSTRDRTFAIEWIQEPSKRLELYAKYAFRVSTALLATDFSNTTFTSLAQYRATYRVGRKFDVVGELRYIEQPVSSYVAFGEVAEAGYHFGNDFRAAVGYSFGRTNDLDFTGSRSRGGLYLDFNARVNELFRGFGLQQAPRPDLSGAGTPAAAAATHLTGIDK